MDSTILIALLLLLLLAFFIILPRWMLQKSIRQLIITFRSQRATVYARALTLEQIGINKRSSILSTLPFAKRDYKRKALLMLIQNEVVKLEKGKLYLQENKLSQLHW